MHIYNVNELGFSTVHIQRAESPREGRNTRLGPSHVVLDGHSAHTKNLEAIELA
jgi:hypothetical protein